ncbi:hypothetical protein LTR66_014125 [Elasticomyces elasticus]|nr:hypothetical protein LTR66_014125 [Elasticomyces elasticus]
MSLTQKHAANSLVDESQILLLTGNINVPKFGNASAVLFNGTHFQPFILTGANGNGGGSISGIFVSNPGNFVTAYSRHLAIGFIVLISLAIALGLVFLLLGVLMFLHYRRRRQDGYSQVSQRMVVNDKNNNMDRVPPDTLLAGLGEKDPPPKI